MAEPFSIESPLWFATAPAAAETPPLSSDASADVCISGFARLSTALHLAEADRSAIVLEQHEPG